MGFGSRRRFIGGSLSAFAAAATADARADTPPNQRMSGEFAPVHDPSIIRQGHCAVLHDGDRDYLVYHAYDAANAGVATLRISPIYWTPDAWPRAQL